MGCGYPLRKDFPVYGFMSLNMIFNKKVKSQRTNYCKALEILI